MPRMNDTLQPPTDNLYKFIAIAGIAVALLALVFLFREQARLREVYLNAQVELRAGGYVEGSGIPADVELRRTYLRRDLAASQGDTLMELGRGPRSKATGWALGLSVVAFGAWWWRVQRHEDAILRITAAKLLREEQAASAPARASHVISHTQGRCVPARVAAVGWRRVAP